MRQAILDTIKSLEAALYAANVQLIEFDMKPENNVYDDLDIASSKIESKLRNLASESCGDSEFGEDVYTQEFIVTGKTYIAILDVEYDRYDKRYYFVDRAKFRIEEI